MPEDELKEFLEMQEFENAGATSSDEISSDGQVVTSGGQESQE